MEENIQNANGTMENETELEYVYILFPDTDTPVKRVVRGSVWWDTPDNPVNAE